MDTSTCGVLFLNTEIETRHLCLTVHLINIVCLCHLQVPLNSIEYLTRVHYQAPSDGQWGEHEIDYILFVQGDVDVTTDPNEVSDYRFVTSDQLKEMISTADCNGIKITPWFRLIAASFLFNWWDNLRSLQSQKDHLTIHRM